MYKGGHLKHLLFLSEFNQPRIFFADFEISSNMKFKWFPRFQVATTCFSCSPPDLNSVVTIFMFCLHVKYPLPPGDNPIAVNNNNNNNNNNYYYYYYIIIK